MLLDGVGRAIAVRPDVVSFVPNWTVVIREIGCLMVRLSLRGWMAGAVSSSDISAISEWFRLLVVTEAAVRVLVGASGCCCCPFGWAQMAACDINVNASRSGPNLVTISATAFVQERSDDADSETDELIQWAQCQTILEFSFMAVNPVFLMFAHFVWNDSEQILHLTNSGDVGELHATAWHFGDDIFVRTTTAFGMETRKDEM